MKRLFLLSLCAILLLTGCLPTPEVEVIPNKGELKTWQVEANPYVQEEQAEAAAPAAAPARRAWRNGKSCGTGRHRPPRAEPPAGACSLPCG